MSDSRESPKLGELLKHLGGDLKTIASTELELTRNKMADYAETMVMRTSVVIIGGFVAFIGLAMLCVVGVLLMHPLIDLIWVRLLIMAGVYILVGGGAVLLYVRRAAAAPDLGPELDELKQTAAAVSDGLKK